MAEIVVTQIAPHVERPPKCTENGFAAADISGPRGVKQQDQAGLNSAGGLKLARDGQLTQTCFLGRRGARCTEPGLGGRTTSGDGSRSVYVETYYPTFFQVDSYVPESGTATKYFGLNVFF
jgi:hypothetical protein